jgi:hypothetical protein
MAISYRRGIRILLTLNVYQNIDVKNPTMFAGKNGKGFEVKDLCVVEGVGKGSTHFSGQSLATAPLKFGCGIG